MYCSTTVIQLFFVVLVQVLQYSTFFRSDIRNYYDIFKILFLLFTYICEKMTLLYKVLEFF